MREGRGDRAFTFFKADPTKGRELQSPKTKFVSLVQRFLVTWTLDIPEPTYVPLNCINNAFRK